MQAPAKTLTVRVLLFAAFREALGARRLDLELPEGATVEDAFTALGSGRPGLAELRPFTSFAVNRELVSGDTPLRNGDEIAFLQPVSGGAA